MNDAVVADGLTKRYGRTVALDRCSFAIPEHTIVALVGPNGAGKSTLLHCATGLVHPTEGTITVLGGPAGDRTLPRVGFVAQDAPLYRDFTADELLTMGDKLNHEFDLPFARARLVDVGIPLDRRVDRLSGGQRAQVALCLALAKRPGLLLLDEPLASLDPLARREFLSALMDAVAEEPMTVVLSSHLIADLERVCDHLMVLRSGQVTAARRHRRAGCHAQAADRPTAAAAAEDRRRRPDRVGLQGRTTDPTPGANQRRHPRPGLGPVRRLARRRRPGVPGGARRRTAARPRGGGRMTWLVWRQHRKQLLFALAALVVLGCVLHRHRPPDPRPVRAGGPPRLPP